MRLTGQEGRLDCHSTDPKVIQIIPAKAGSRKAPIIRHSVTRQQDSGNAST